MTMNTKTTKPRAHPKPENKPAKIRDAAQQITLRTLSNVERMVDAAKTPPEPIAIAVRDLARNARQTRIAFGRLGNAALGQMDRSILGPAKAQIKTGKNTFRKGGALLAGTASGVLAGIAERLQPSPIRKDDHSKPVSDD
jgi:hypothetical protein